MAVALSLYDPGDEVLDPEPGVRPVRRSCEALRRHPGARTSLSRSVGSCPTSISSRRCVTPKTRAIVVNSPSNPTGGVFPTAVVERIVEFAEEHDLTIVSDEVYEEMVYEGKFASFWGRGDRTVIVNSFSKTLAMTGWRIGFLVAPRSLAVEINKIHYHMLACPSTPVQTAVLAGLTHSQRGHRRHGAGVPRAAVAVRRGPQQGHGTEVRPTGRARSTRSLSSPGRGRRRRSRAHLLQRGLITTPGDAFGSLGTSHLRLSFAASRENLRRALGILRSYSAEVGGG